MDANKRIIEITLFKSISFSQKYGKYEKGHNTLDKVLKSRLKVDSIYHLLDF
jgi:hypothetical protein